MSEVDIYKLTDRPLSDIELQFDVKAVDPIMGNKLSAKMYFDCILPEYNKSGKLLSPPELGCALSHIKIYESIVSSNTPAIILETDIEPKRNQLSEAISLCSASNEDFIHLGWHPSTEYGVFIKGKKKGKLYLIDPNNNFYGTFAYYVSVDAASQLLQFQSNSIKLADSWAQFFMQSNIEPYFKPIFVHPPVRSDLSVQKMSVSRHIYNIQLQSIQFYLKKLLVQKLSKFKFWNKEIKP
jgi:glycosyl transferase family 25